MNKISTITIAAALVGSIMGSGFASGQELMQFFGKYGVYGLVASFFVGIGLILLSIIVLLTARRMNTSSYEVVVAPPVAVLRRSVNILLTLFSLAAMMVILSGAGAIAETLFHLPPFAVNAAMALVLLSTGWSDGQKILSVLSISVPVVTIMMIFVAVAGIFTGETSLGNSQLFGNFTLAQCAASAGTYISYNFSGALVVLVGMGTSIPNKKTLYGGCILGGTILGLIAVLVCSSIIRNYGIAAQSPMPMLDIALSQNQFLAYLYSGILLITIFNTAAALLFGLLERFVQYSVPVLKNRRLMLVCILLVTLYGSKFGFVTLVATIYPIQGYANLAILALMLYNFAVCHRRTVQAN